MVASSSPEVCCCCWEARTFDGMSRSMWVSFCFGSSLLLCGGEECDSLDIIDRTIIIGWHCIGVVLEVCKQVTIVTPDVSTEKFYLVLATNFIDEDLWIIQTEQSLKQTHDYSCGCGTYTCNYGEVGVVHTHVTMVKWVWIIKLPLSGDYRK